MDTIQAAVLECSHLFQQLHFENTQVCADGAQEKQLSLGHKAQSYSVVSKDTETDPPQIEIQAVLILFFYTYISRHFYVHLCEM